MTVDDKVPLVQWGRLSRLPAAMYVARSWEEVTGRPVVSSRAWRASQLLTGLLADFDHRLALGVIGP